MDVADVSNSPASAAELAILDRLNATQNGGGSPSPVAVAPPPKEDNIFDQLRRSTQGIARSPTPEGMVIQEGGMEGHNPTQRVVPQVSQQQFDPRVLLNPRAHSKPPSQPQAIGFDSRDVRGRSAAQGSGPGLGSQMERLHNIHARAEQSPKRPRVDEDEQRKKARLAPIVAGGLSTSPHPAAQPGHNVTIDLTTTGKSFVSPFHEVVTKSCEWMRSRFQLMTPRTNLSALVVSRKPIYKLTWSHINQPPSIKETKTPRRV